MGAEALSDEALWEEQAHLLTLDEAAKNAPWHCNERYEEWRERSRGMNVSDAVTLARRLGTDIQWDAEACRNHRGWYRYQGGWDATIARGVLLAPICDVVFPCIWGVDLDGIERFAKEIQERFPRKWLGLNWSVPPDGKSRSITQMSMI